MSVTFYDIPTKRKTPWSFNPGKVRLALNFKKVEYKTEWIEYPDLEPTLKALGIQPHDSDDPHTPTYTSPAIKFEDGKQSTYVMDSWNIVQELEKRYPEPSLHLDDPIVAQIREYIPKLFNPIRDIIIPKVPRVFLSARSTEYFERTREESLGKPLAQIEKEAGGVKGWVETEAVAAEIAALLKKQGGPFFLGTTVSYADFLLVCWLQFIKLVDPASYERFTALDPAFPRLHEASAQWLVKID